nr:hypothetical protein HmN_000303200 [Hymenolepis microstoma]
MILFLPEQSPFTRLSPFVHSHSLRMSSETDLDVNALGIPLGYPIFNPEYSDVWFFQLKVSFQLCGVDKQRMMLRHAVAALPYNVTSLAFEIVDNASEDIRLRWYHHEATGLHHRTAEKLEQFVPAISSCRGKRRPMSPKKLRSPSKDRSKICFYHRTYGNYAKKCQPGCNCPRIDSAISKPKATGPEVSIITRSAEKCFQPFDLTIHATNNQFRSFYRFFPSFCIIKHQDSNTIEPLDPYCQQSSTMVNAVKEVI